MKLNNTKIILIVIAVVTVIALAFAFVQYQTNNRKLSIQDAQYKMDRAREEADKFSLRLCISASDTVYWDYIKLNGTSKGDGVWTAKTSDWNAAQAKKDSAIRVCELKYGN